MLQEGSGMTEDLTYKKINKIRVLNYGDYNYLDSQAIYHAVAHSFEKNTPDTLVIISPFEAYACIGFFQDMEKEIDLDFCRKMEIPVLRREVGGGAVLLDNNQVFFQFIFHKNRAPGDVNGIYADFLEPAVSTYNRLGLKVFHRPINDLQIEGRKIGGTGAVQIGISTVVVGSFMFDFNYELMSRILKVPSEKFRDKLYKNVKDYITNIKREYGHLKKDAPERKEVISIFFEEVQKKFGADLFFENDLGEYEQKMLLKIRKKLNDRNWLYRKGKFPDRKVKISSGVNLIEGNFKRPGGLIRITLIKEDDIIKDIAITGDFTLVPSESLGLIEKELTGLKIDYSAMKERLKKIYKRCSIQSPGIEPEDFIEALETIIKNVK